MVQQLTPLPQALRIRVLDYLYASGLGAATAEAWADALLAAIDPAAEDASHQLIAAAQRRVNAWLGESLQLETESSQALLVARASLPYWQAATDAANPLLSSVERERLRSCCIRATPPEAALEMPTQTLSLRSVSSVIGGACKECVPRSVRLGRRLHTWLRSV